MNPKRRRPGPVVVRCTSCGWEIERSTWRPARRRLAEHVAHTHPGLAVAE